MQKGKIPVIVGPTGSGKTGVSIRLAKKIGGEIISADSRAIYKGMDIGTAKPSIEERAGVLHYGFDLVEPGERFTAFDFKKYAEQKICSIFQSGKTPIVVGGSGLYVDALIYNYSFDKESKEECVDRKTMDSRFVVFGISVDSDELDKRLHTRIEQMFCDELFSETEKLVSKYGWNNQAMKSDIYQFAYKYMTNQMTLEEAKERAFYEDRHLAKRQMTWFKRNNNIIWEPLEKIEEVVLKCIQNDNE